MIAFSYISQINEYINIFMDQKPPKPREMSYNSKKRSTSMSYLHSSVVNQKKSGFETTANHDKTNKGYHNCVNMFALKDQCLYIKKDFLATNYCLIVVYDLSFSSNDENFLSPNLYKAQRLILNLKQLDLVISKNDTKHFHKISPDFSGSDIVIDLKKENKISQIYIESQNWSKKLQIDPLKLNQVENNSQNHVHEINPFHFIEEGIKLRAMKIQSTGKKKISWGQNSVPRLSHPQIVQVNPYHDITKASGQQNSNDQFKSLCSKKLDFSKYEKKQGIFSNYLLKSDKTLIPSSNNKSKYDVILKQKNRTQHLISKGNQNSLANDATKGYKGASKKLQNFLNQNIQKPVCPQKKKAISYKTDMREFHKFSQSIQMAQQSKKNKQNDHKEKKPKPRKQQPVKNLYSQMGVDMIKSIRIKTQAT